MWTLSHPASKGVPWPVSSMVPGNGECKHIHKDLKDGNVCLSRMKLESALVELHTYSCGHDTWSSELAVGVVVSCLYK